MIRLPMTVDGILTDADYKLMVGLTDALPNPPNYPTAELMSRLLRHDVVRIDDALPAIASVHPNKRMEAVVGRYLLPKNIGRQHGWELIRPCFIEIAERWPATLNWPAIMPLLLEGAADLWVEHFAQWPVAVERGDKLNDSDLGYVVRWQRFEGLVNMALAYEGPGLDNAP